MSEAAWRVLGVDPGSARTGYGVVESDGHALRVIAFGCIETPPGLEPAPRLGMVYDGLKDLLRRYAPDAAAVEELFFAKNARTVIGVAQARGVALLALGQAGISVAEYTPLQVKVAVVGQGRAQKFQVQQMVALLLHLPEPPQPDDTADALAVAICHLNRGDGGWGMGVGGPNVPITAFEQRPLHPGGRRPNTVAPNPQPPTPIPPS